MNYFQDTVTLFGNSKKELTKTKTLVLLALFMAFSISVSAVTRIRTPFFSISLGPIIKMYVGLLFGPVTGAVYGFSLDILQFFIDNRGDAFFPGYTFTETLGVFLYGLFLYRRPLKFNRVLLAKFVVVVICNILLGTLWMSIMNGKAFLFYLPPRVWKNLCQWIADSVVFYALAKALSQAGVTRMIRNENGPGANS